jgi:replication factor C subunit 2/4
MSTKIWTFVHEPKKFDEMILNDVVKPRLEKVLKEIPNLMLIGPAGVGKGTFVNIFLKETKLDFMKLNCSDETSVDAMRTKVKGFSQALGITPLKVVVLNESDYLSPSAQAMLRDLMEQVQGITRFIFQCNYGHKMIPEIKSRCQVIEMENPPAKQIYYHVSEILKKEKVKVKDPKVVVSLIKDLYPDIRGIINTLQLNTVEGAIDSIRYDQTTEVYNKILNHIIKREVEEIRKVLRNHTVNYVDIYKHLFDNVGEFKSPGDAILLIGEYLYRDSLIAIREINFMTMVVDMMKKGVV